jgi:dTDP-4-amino-4,6-dideoxygalactose transaminase
MGNTDLPVILGGEPIRTKPYGTYPRAFGDEIAELQGVLESGDWNQNYAGGEIQKRFEKDLAEYLGVRNTVAVSSGGVALQIAMRGLGIEPGDEVLVQVDTCIADAFAIFNAGAVPVFADSDPETFMLDFESVEKTIGPRTKAIIPVHIWGRPENTDMVQKIAKAHNLLVIDDACLACGAEWKGRKAGTSGDVGIYSFGCLKPFQSGEGGAIATDDDKLAKDLRVLRSWGEMQFEYGIRDYKELAWNGRISQLLAAVLIAQLRGYPSYLAGLQENAVKLENLISDIPGIRIMDRDERITASAHTQFIFKIDEDKLGMSRDLFEKALGADGVPMVWHGAFEPIVGTDFFRNGRWRTWAVGHPDHDRLAENYSRPYPGAEKSFNHGGMSIGRNVLCSGDDAVQDTADIIRRICENAGKIMSYEL